jgi:histidinol-phosphate aminotransferase
MRLGVAIGDAALIDGLQRVKNSFNSYPVDVLAQAAGIASIEDDRYYRETVGKILETRRWTEAQLETRGFEVLPSSANFLFARPAQPAADLFVRLSDAGILVRYWNKPRLQEWLRISIGTPAEMKALMACIDA